MSSSVAPSPKATRPQVGKKQSKISAFGRIVKISPSAPSQKSKFPPVAPAVRSTEASDLCPVTTKKRRYNTANGEDGCDHEEPVEAPVSKKTRIAAFESTASTSKIVQPKTQPHASGTSSPVSTVKYTPPVSPQPSCTSLSPVGIPEYSSDEPVSASNLPLALKSLLALHEKFLKALSIHFAHNGLSAPAELGGLMKTITCLWKKNVVRMEDIQRMLALYEIFAEQDRSDVVQPGCNVSHREGPFRLISLGGAGRMGMCVEYVGVADFDTRHVMRRPFSEKDLQDLFELDLLCLYRASRKKLNSHLSFLSGSLADFPLLSCTVGAQSASRREKSSARRIEILSISNASQQRQQKKLSYQLEPFAETSEKAGVEVPRALKSRTQSLFDRIAARQAVDASSTAPTAADILRRHAVCRISEVVEILRMKQQQKSVGRNHLLANTIGTSPTKLGQRVSFSMKQLQIEIRDSASVPIADEEAKLCLRMLAEHDATSKWLKILDSGVGDRMSVFVVLEGHGMPGRDVQKIFEGRGL